MFFCIFANLFPNHYMITLGYRNKLMGIFLATGAIIVGIIFLAAPESAIETVVRVLAAFLVASGIVSFIFGCKTRDNGAMSLMVVNSAVDIILGVLMFVFAAALSRFILIVLGALLVIFSIREFLALLAARKFVALKPWLAILPIISFIGGVLLMINTFGEKIMGILCGIVLIIFGVSELIAALRVKRAINEFDIQAADKINNDIKAKQEEFSDIVDVDCQKVEDSKD